MLHDNLRRRLLAVMVGAVGVLLIAVPLGFAHEHLSLATPALLLVLPVIVAAVLGGRWPSIVVALCAALAFNVVFIPPFLTLQIDHPDDVVAYVVFATVAVVVGGLVARESDRRRLAELQATEIARVHAALVDVTTEKERLAAEAQKVSVLQEVDRQRSVLLRSVSHDLRTPLVTIRGVASDLREGDLFDQATKNDLLDLVIAEAERLDRLVQNLLSFSRIDAGALEPRVEVVECAELIDRCVRRLRRLFSESSVEVSVDPDLPPLLVDPGLLDQVLTNLLENAVQHGGHHTRVSASTAGDSGSPARWVIVTVDDDGRGLGTIDRELLFEPWNAVGNSSLSGVGLAICRSIVEAHGGIISGDDNPSGGARFSFTVPVFPGNPETDEQG